jgi:hypothetical protein
MGFRLTIHAAIVRPAAGRRIVVANFDEFVRIEEKLDDLISK